MHRFASQCPAIGLAAHSVQRQPKKQWQFGQKASCMAVIPGRIEDANPESRDSGFYASHSPGMTNLARMLVRKASISARRTSASRRSALEAPSTSPAADPASAEAVETPTMLLETSAVPPAAC